MLNNLHWKCWISTVGESFTSMIETLFELIVLQTTCELISRDDKNSTIALKVSNFSPWQSFWFLTFLAERASWKAAKGRVRPLFAEKDVPRHNYNQYFGMGAAAFDCWGIFESENSGSLCEWGEGSNWFNLFPLVVFWQFEVYSSSECLKSERGNFPNELYFAFNMSVSHCTVHRCILAVCSGKALHWSKSLKSFALLSFEKSSTQIAVRESEFVRKKAAWKDFLLPLSYSRLDCSLSCCLLPF